ncbi:MAG: DUF484 family protein [Woeseia sp.]
MSTQRKPEFSEEPVSESDVQAYLESNPDFFERHAALLDTLRLPHATGAAISLVERQVSVLRQKDLKLERRMKELLEVARANDVLAGKIHQLALRLLTTSALPQTLEAVEESLRTAFGADHSVLVLFGKPASFIGISAGRFFKAIERENPALQPFATFLRSSNPRCGQVRDAQRDFLFGPETDEVGSAALLPLGSDCRIGFLAIGSVDANRFHPGMGFDFLARLADLVEVALQRDIEAEPGG